MQHISRVNLNQDTNENIQVVVIQEILKFWTKSLTEQSDKTMDLEKMFTKTSANQQG